MHQYHTILYLCGAADIFRSVRRTFSLWTTRRLYLCRNMLFHHAKHNVINDGFIMKCVKISTLVRPGFCKCQFLGFRPFHRKVVFKLKRPPGKLCMFSAGILNKHAANKCCFIFRATFVFPGLFVHRLKSHQVYLVMSTSQPVSSSQISSYMFCRSINMQACKFTVEKLCYILSVKRRTITLFRTRQSPPVLTRCSSDRPQTFCWLSDAWIRGK